MMIHRNLDLTPETEFCLSAIDEIISHGEFVDWAELREAVHRDKKVKDGVKHICKESYNDIYFSQRYRFWLSYVQNF
jgi:hypothetical protein